MIGGPHRPHKWIALKSENLGKSLPASSWFCFAPSSNPGSVLSTSCTLSLPPPFLIASLCLQGTAPCVRKSFLRQKGSVLLPVSESLDSPTRAGCPLSTVPPIY